MQTRERSGQRTVLLLGKRNRKVQDLERLLTEQSWRVHLASNAEDALGLIRNADFDIILVGDAMAYVMRGGFFKALRTLCPDAKLMCLADEITEEMEMVMRSGGLVFLGSYRQFEEFHQEILQSALRSRKGAINA